MNMIGKFYAMAAMFMPMEVHTFLDDVIEKERLRKKWRESMKLPRKKKKAVRKQLRKEWDLLW